MDKNTLTGLLLMGLVFFGFIWYSQSTAEKQMAEERSEAIEAAVNARKEANAPLNIDSLSLLEALRSVGEHSGQTYTYSEKSLKLSVDSAGNLEGTVYDGVKSIDLKDVLAGGASLTLSQKRHATEVLRRFIDNAVKYEGFARFLGGEAKETVLENDLVKVTLTSLGAKVSQVELKKYKTERKGDSSNILLFTGATDGYGFRFNTADQRIDTREFNFKTRIDADSSVFMYIEPTEGSLWGIRYKLANDGYNVSMSIEQYGMANILPANTSSMDFVWNQQMGRNEVGRTFEERNSGIFYKFVGEGVDELNANKDDSEELNGRVRWVSFKNQFFSSVIIAREAFTSAEIKSNILKDDDYLKQLSMTSTHSYNTEDGTAASFDFYFGPNDYPILSGLDDKLGYDEGLSLTRLIPLGWTLFRWINTIIVIPVFTFLGKFISNYGLIIFLLTLFIKLIIFPFTYKSFKSQAKMRVLAPEIKAINEKYADQSQMYQRQQETMALYSRVGASPFSGCLPMLLQMPVLIAMFSFFPSAIELRGQSFLWAHDLSAPDYVLALPFSIPFYGDHVSLFCLLMTVINIVYMRISMQNQPQSEGMPGMKIMQYMMPVMFLFIFNDYAAGLSYYYLLSLLITIIQTYAFRHLIDEKKVRAQLMENAKKPRKKSGFMARLEEAQKQALAAQRAQQKQQQRRR